MYKQKLYDNSAQTVEDSEHWKQINRGERAGLEALYLKYSQQLFRLGMAINGNQSLVKDCIQEVFFKIWQYRHTVKVSGNAKLYLFKCLSNKIHKEVGKDKKRYGHLNLMPQDQMFIVPDLENDTSSADDKKRKDFLEALTILFSRQLEVIHLLYYENHSYEDVAKIMGINVQSVYTLAWKAIANLKRRFTLVGLILLSLVS